MTVLLKDLICGNLQPPKKGMAYKRVPPYQMFIELSPKKSGENTGEWA